MYGINEMPSGGGDEDVSAKLQVLNEIKELMDKRLGGKLGEMGKPKGVEVSSVKVLDDKEPEGVVAEMPKEEGALSDEDLMKLKMLRSKMLG